MAAVEDTESGFSNRSKLVVALILIVVLFSVIPLLTFLLGSAIVAFTR